MRLTLPLALLLAACTAPAFAQDPPTQPKPEAAPAATAEAATTDAGLPTDDDKALYALGLSIWRNLAQLDLSPAEVEIVRRAIADAAAGKPAISLDTYGPKIDAFARGRVQRTVDKEKARSQEYLDKAATEPGAQKAESGLVFFDVQPGTGASPTADDTVKVHYRGTLIDGTEFDSSYKRDEPAQFPLGGVIRCWTEGLQKMKVGGKAKLACPASIAYGDRGRPGIPGGAALIFEVELLEVVKQEPSAAPPAAATPAPEAAPSPKPEVK